MSTTILIHDKDELPTYQSLSTPERYEFSEYFQKPSRLNNNQPSYILHCCYFTFFILTIIAISYGGYYYFKPTLQSSSDGPSTALLPFAGKGSNYHHYKLISSESNSDDNDDSDYNDSSDDNNDDDDNDALYHALQKIKNATKSNVFFPKIHESSSPFGSKIEISDVDGDVDIIGK